MIDLDEAVKLARGYLAESWTTNADMGLICRALLVLVGRRTAEQERADVVAWLGGRNMFSSAAAEYVASGEHVGAASKETER